MIRNLRDGVMYGLRTVPRILFLSLLISMFILFIPDIFNSLYGDKAVSSHLKEVVGNEKNSTVIAHHLMGWIENSTGKPYSQKRILGFYNISNKLTFFIRTNKASWVIYSKMGNCGEDAWYFAELMNKSGFKSRVISVEGEDHAFAEFYDENNNRIVVDPSANRFVDDILSFTDNRSWSRLEAIDLNGKKEDVTKDFLRNVSTLTINVSENSFLSKYVNVRVDSVFLKSRVSMYDSPIEVIANDFKDRQSLVFSLGQKREYQIVKSLNLYLIYFEEREDLDLSNDKQIIIRPETLIKLKNFRVGVLGALLIVFACVLYLKKHQRKIKAAL